MLSFKQLIRQDNRDVFMNDDEFAEKHFVNGRKMSAILDTNELEEREKRLKEDMTTGVYKKQILFYVRASDFGRMPSVGSVLEFDRKRYIVTNAINEDGIYSVEAEANRS